MKLFSKIKEFFIIGKYARMYGMTRKEYKKALKTTIDISSCYPISMYRKINKQYTQKGVGL